MLSVPLLTFSFSLLSLLGNAIAKPCVAFDAASFGLYVFGLEHDVSLGPSSGWNANPLQMTNLTRTGRPPFNGNNTQCFLSQFQNSLYVLNADTSQPSNVHIFSFDSQSWSTEQVTSAGTSPTSLVAILDRDTDVFFAMSDSQLYQLDMGDLGSADGTTRNWESVLDTPFFAQNGAYPNPVMALAQNHIQFLDVGTPGSAAIFVIHFAFMQPDLQPFAPSGGQAFPSVHGTTASIFKPIPTVQQFFAFIPDDGSATYIFDAIANTTQQIQGPMVKTTGMIAASESEIVQMTTSGEVYWIPISQNDTGANDGAVWTKINVGIPLPSNTTSSGNTTRSGTSSATGTHTGTTPASTTSSGALRNINDGLILGMLIAGLGLCGLWSSL